MWNIFQHLEDCRLNTQSPCHFQSPSWEPGGAYSSSISSCDFWPPPKRIFWPFLWTWVHKARSRAKGQGRGLT